MISRRHTEQRTFQTQRLPGAGLQDQRHRSGFTAIEVVIMSAILMVIAGIIVVNFPSFSQSIAIQRSARELALSLREAQNMAFAVREVTTPTGERTPPAFGIYFNRLALPNSYIVFADLGPSGTNDKRYDPTVDVIIKTVELSRGITFAQLISDVGGTNQTNDIINVTFTVPEARVDIRSDAGAFLGESAEIYLTALVSEFEKRIFITTTGQLEIR